MLKQINRGDVVEILHTLDFETTLSVMMPVAAYLPQPLRIIIPKETHGLVENIRKDNAYVRITAADDVEVRRWIPLASLEKVS